MQYTVLLLALQDPGTSGWNTRTQAHQEPDTSGPWHIGTLVLQDPDTPRPGLSRTLARQDPGTPGPWHSSTYSRILAQPLLLTEL
jgi:hypothetical protein